MYLIPILAGYHRHTVDGKIFVQLVKGCGSPTASAADDAGTGLALEQGALAVKCPVQEGSDHTGSRCIMHRRSEDKSVCSLRFFHKFIHAILPETLSVLQTGIAADTSGDGLCTHLDDLRLNTVFLQCSRYFLQSCVGTALRMSASVYQ